jgi:ABC-type uncharacterized transport system substrate-binding protein
MTCRCGAVINWALKPVSPPRCPCGLIWLAVVLAFSLFLAPLVVEAQQGAKVPRIGYLRPSLGTPTLDARFVSFRQALRELGYVEGTTILIEVRSADGKADRLPALAAELVRLKVDVLVAEGGTPSVLAAKTATQTIPIVFPTMADPVAQGVVTSLARPGGNLTGLSLQSRDIAGKLLELLKEMVSRATRVAFLVNPDNPGLRPSLPEVQIAAKKLGIESLVIAAKAPVDFGGAFAEMVRKRADALVIWSDAMLNAQSSSLARLAAEHKLPTIGDSSGLPENGASPATGRIDWI